MSTYPALTRKIPVSDGLYSQFSDLSEVVKARQALTAWFVAFVCQMEEVGLRRDLTQYAYLFETLTEWLDAVAVEIHEKGGLPK